MKRFVDDKYTHLEEDVDKIRQKYRMYISFSGPLAAKAIVLEILYNALDECRNPRSPANKIDIIYDESKDMITVEDNGRGIPTDVLNTVLTKLNSGSNIDSGSKVDLETNTLGRNGVGTLAMTALGEFTEVTTYRGGTEDKYKIMTFNEGKLVSEREGKTSQHGLLVKFVPSKILGKNTKIIWSQIREELVNFQYLNDKQIKMTSTYIDKKGEVHKETYKTQPFESILSFRNNKEYIIGDKIKINIEDKDITEEIGGKKYKRFIYMDIAFVYTNTPTPYIDSFCNGNNTIDNGSHLDGVVEAMCRFFQMITKNSLTERDKLDIKWDDVKTGLSLVVSLNTNMEEIFTSQTKHKVSNEELEKIIKDKTIEALASYSKSNPNKVRDVMNIIKTNARARREGDKARSAVVKETMTNWSSFKMKNYDPCTNKGKEYKELYIIEGDSAKGSLKLSRDPKFQALFAVRGVSANVFKLDLNGVLANKEFNDLIKVMGCNVGSRFDLTKLQFDKIVIASDADVDGLFIRSLLCSFYFKVFPEIIEDGRLFIAEPPLYRVDDKKNPFVINKEDYIERYIKQVMKEYRIASVKNGEFDQKKMMYFLSETSSYVDDLTILAKHYKVNDRLLEIIIEEWPVVKNGKSLINRINEEFAEIWYDEKDHLLKGIIDGKYQLLELSDGLFRKAEPLREIMLNVNDNGSTTGMKFLLKNTKTGAEQDLSLLGTLKVLKKFQPNILHRFKGLGENNDEDIKTTIMDPNTRTLIKVQISDIENDMKVFQTLRGTSLLDAQNRKAMMREYKIPRDLIDT